MEYDYVIVGGGSAGSVLAARLSENSKVSVCLLEAVGAGRDFVIRAPAMVVTMVSGRPKINNWALQTEPQPGLNGRRGYQPRGKVLGGSGGINAMLYCAATPRVTTSGPRWGARAGIGTACCPISNDPSGTRVLRSFSRGQVGLNSANPRDASRIDPAFLSDPRDLELLMTGARQMETLLAAAPDRGQHERADHHDGREDRG